MKQKQISKQQQKEQQKDTKSNKPKRPADKARKEYDERLILMNQNVRDMIKTRLGEPTPVCPSCESTNAKPLSPRRGLLVGIKPCFKCKDCGRTYVLDDARYRNTYLKLQAALMVSFGGSSMAGSAIKLLHDYGINMDHSDIMRWLKSMSNATK